MGNRNQKNYLVATQDKSLEESLNGIPRVPILQLINGSILEMLDSSQKTKDLLTKRLNEKLKLDPQEEKELIEFRKETKEDNYQQKLKKVRNYRNKLGVKVHVKKAQGPNP